MVLMNVNSVEKKNVWLKMFSGSTVSVSITLILILLFAVLIRFVGVSDNLIFPVNQVIKVISLFLGAFIAFKGNREKGLLKGLILGFAYYIINYLVFSTLQGDFSLTISNLYDLLLTTVMGGLVGLIVVHIGK